MLRNNLIPLSPKLYIISSNQDSFTHFRISKIANHFDIVSSFIDVSAFHDLITNQLKKGELANCAFAIDYNLINLLGLSELGREKDIELFILLYNSNNSGEYRVSAHASNAILYPSSQNVYFNSPVVAFANCKTSCGILAGKNIRYDFEGELPIFQTSSSNIPKQHSLITVGEQPYFLKLKQKNLNLFFLPDMVPPNIEDEYTEPIELHIFNLLPILLFLRDSYKCSFFTSHNTQATLVIDDPILISKYGYLNYRNLLSAMDSAGFSTNIAFIPYNYRMNSRKIIDLFLKRRDILSISYHGCNHTSKEFGTNDEAKLNHLINKGKRKMKRLKQKTGLKANDVMVFPQEVWSVEAMKSLKLSNFLASSTSRCYPHMSKERPKISDFLLPALTCFSNFPLFQRKYVDDVSAMQIAFWLFLSKPIILVDHHKLFKNNFTKLLERVNLINSLCPDIKWTNLESIAINSYLKRELPDGTIEIKAICRSHVYYNNTDQPKCVRVTKPEETETQISHILVNGSPVAQYAYVNGILKFEFTVKPKCESCFEIIYKNSKVEYIKKESLKNILKVASRRYLCLIRDMYLSKLV